MHMNKQINNAWGSYCFGPWLDRIQWHLWSFQDSKITLYTLSQKLMFISTTVKNIWIVWLVWTCIHLYTHKSRLMNIQLDPWLILCVQPVCVFGIVFKKIFPPTVFYFTISGFPMMKWHSFLSTQHLSQSIFRYNIQGKQF